MVKHYFVLFVQVLKGTKRQEGEFTLLELSQALAALSLQNTCFLAFVFQRHFHHHPHPSTSQAFGLNYITSHLMADCGTS